MSEADANHGLLTPLALLLPRWLSGFPGLAGLAICWVLCARPRGRKSSLPTPLSYSALLNTPAALLPCIAPASIMPSSFFSKELLRLSSRPEEPPMIQVQRRRRRPRLSDASRNSGIQL